MKRMLEAVIFDMDGVLVDTEYTFLESKYEMLKEAGFHLDISYQYQFMGTTFDFMWQKMKEELNLPLSVEAYIHEMNRKRAAMIERDGIRAIKYAPELVKRLASSTMKLGLASSSPKPEILRAVREIGIEDCFLSLVSSEEVPHSKPAPDVFLETARQLGVEPNNCLVFEDTPNGTKAAAQAGMYVIGFANPDFPEQELPDAHRIVHTFKDISLKNLENWMQQ